MRKVLLLGMNVPRLPGRQCRIPLDLGYVKSFIDSIRPGQSQVSIRVVDLHLFKFNRLFYNLQVVRAAKAISEDKNDAVVFFLDNMLRSTSFYLDAFTDLARVLKEKDPGLVIGFQTYKLDTQSADDLIKESPADIFFLGEPEEEILKLVDGEKCDSEVVSCAFRERSRENLDLFPSPYLCGTLDDYLLDKRYIPVVTAKRGCYGRCYYCFRSVKHKAVEFFSFGRVMAELKYIYDKGKKDIIIADDDFIVSRKYLNEFANHFRLTFGELGQGPNLSVLTRPEKLSPETIGLLKCANVSNVQFGVQSVNEELFHMFGRTASLRQIQERAEYLRKGDIQFVVDAILALPGDTFEDFKRTMEFIVGLRPNVIQVKQLALSPLTKFYKERRQYGFVTEKKPRFKSMTPLIIKNKTFNAGDACRAISFLKQMACRHKDITWKVTTSAGRFFRLGGSCEMIEG